MVSGKKTNKRCTENRDKITYTFYDFSLEIRSWRLGLPNIPTAPLQRDKTPFNETTCWLLVATRNPWGQDRSKTRVLSGHATCNIIFKPLLELDRGSERLDLINRLVMSISSIYMMKSRSYSTNYSCGKQTHNPFDLKRSEKAVVNHVERNS